MAGVIDTLQFALTLAFALPVGLMGATFLLDGRSLGAAFLVVAAGMVLVQQYLTTPKDVPLSAAERVTGWIVKDRD